MAWECALWLQKESQTHTVHRVCQLHFPNVTGMTNGRRVGRQCDDEQSGWVGISGI